MHPTNCMRGRMRLISGTIVVVVMLLAVTHAGAEPGYGNPLTITNGTVYSVGTLSDLKSAFSSVNSAGIPATILI